MCSLPTDKTGKRCGEQGYPIRLIVPGMEETSTSNGCNACTFLDQPAMTRDESATMMIFWQMENRMLQLFMEAKSIVTRPAGGSISPGREHMRSLVCVSAGRALPAWKVSTDAEKNWQKAELQQAVLKNAAVRFRLPWNWTAMKRS